MVANALAPETALRYDIEVSAEGRVELRVPFAPGERITVLVIKQASDSYDDLLAASESSLALWDNPYDDEDRLVT